MKEDILIRILKNCVLCEGMTDLEIGDFIHSNDSRVRHYDLEESLFTVTSRPSRIYVLLSGEVTVCRDTLSGRRIPFAAMNLLVGEILPRAMPVKSLIMHSTSVILCSLSQLVSWSILVVIQTSGVG